MNATAASVQKTVELPAFTAAKSRHTARFPPVSLVANTALSPEILPHFRLQSPSQKSETSGILQKIHVVSSHRRKRKNTGEAHAEHTDSCDTCSIKRRKKFPEVSHIRKEYLRKVSKLFFQHTDYLYFIFFDDTKSFPKEKSLKKGCYFLGYKKCFPYSLEKYLYLSFADTENLCNFAAVSPWTASPRHPCPHRLSVQGQDVFSFSPRTFVCIPSLFSFFPHSIPHFP